MGARHVRMRLTSTAQTKQCLCNTHHMAHSYRTNEKGGNGEELRRESRTAPHIVHTSHARAYAASSPRKAFVFRDMAVSNTFLCVCLSGFLYIPFPHRIRSTSHACRSIPVTCLWPRNTHEHAPQSKCKCMLPVHPTSLPALSPPRPYSSVHRVISPVGGLCAIAPTSSPQIASCSWQLRRPAGVSRKNLGRKCKRMPTA